MEVPNAAIEKELKEVVVDIKKEYDVSESMGEAPLKPLFIFPLPVDKSDPDLLISYLNQSLMTASDGMKERDEFSFGIKAPEELDASNSRINGLLHTS